MKNLFALLVGINDYKKPLSALNGCIKDVKQIEKFIHTHCKEDFDVHVKKLLDGEATYQGIINAFRSHLKQARPDDVAWFHYSGHGSEEKTAPEFLPLEANGKDQTLICHDSRKSGADHLADKELAVLLQEVATEYVDHSRKEGTPHIVVTLDCCHSGSGTRSAGEDAEWSTRSAPRPSGLPRHRRH